jgi:hypothetical protein
MTVSSQANEKALNETVGHLTVEKARLDRDLSTRQLIADQEIMLVQQSKASVEAANASLRQDLLVVVPAYAIVRRFADPPWQGEHPSRFGP